ncbi:MAG: hypothetical protein U0871_20030 [Gemmataceae bacterium]
MWTPRRVLLLLVCAAGFVGVFIAYVRILGGVDGLPELPTALLAPADDQPPLPPQDVSPTQVRLQEAFGPASPEVTDTIAYRLRFEERGRGLVFACGQPEFAAGEPTRFVTVSPFSVAFFGQQKPAHLRQPGEVTEISTFHADKARLQFDRPVTGPQDIANGKASLVGLELLSVPDLLTGDPRQGTIEVINNQRSADPADRLMFRTVGPLFYQAVDKAAPAADAPHLWTTAKVEVVDRKNLPRPLRSGPTQTAAIAEDEFRKRNLTADILLGVSLPPPTITADGLKIYLKPAEAKGGTGYSGVRLIELPDNVQMNLWADGNAGLPGSAPQTPPPGAKPAAKPTDPPTAALAVAGGLGDAGVLARRFESKTLLVIRTPGAFRFDLAANSARFDAPAPQLVSVARFSPLGRQDNLSCNLLNLDFFGDPQQPPAKPGEKPKPAAGTTREGLAIKAMTATGPHVFLSVEAEQFSAQGTYLHYKSDPDARTTTTILRGTPVLAQRQQNLLKGGDPSTSVDIVLTTLDPPPAKPGEKPGTKKTAIEVRGPGRMEVFDPAANATTLQAGWGRSLVQERDRVAVMKDGKPVSVEQDLLKFEGGGEFVDLKGNLKLTADRLWLWLEPGGEKRGDRPTAAPSNQASPQKLFAQGQVLATSPELNIRKTDQLTCWFRDDLTPPVAPTPAPAPSPAKGEVIAKAGGADPNRKPDAVAQAGPPKKEEPAKPKPPIELSARVVESWMVRAPQPVVAAKVAKPDADKKDDAAPSQKYSLERARCEDRVVVHQDPTDPTKVPRGLDVTGGLLNLSQTAAGSVMTVTGTVLAEAEVHFETLSLYGPVVKIDQPNNAVDITGRGRLRMPSQSDLGGEAGKQTELEVRWTRSMRFDGKSAFAEFLGQVAAVQTPDRGTFRPKAEAAPLPRASGFRPGDLIQPPPAPPPAADGWGWSAVYAHRLDVTFDRPIYFNQLRKPDGSGAADKPGDPNNPKLKKAVCTPMSDDEAAVAQLPARKVVYMEQTFDKAGALTKAQRIEAGQLDLTNDDVRKDQEVIATGPGEVRILQPGSKDPVARPATPGSPAASASAGPAPEMKLTWVQFLGRMVGRDKGKVLQKATFDDGAVVWNVPVDGLGLRTPDEKLNLRFPDHQPPPGAAFLTCTELLEVSTDKTKPDKPEQWMVAKGGAEFQDDKYKGTAPTITYDGVSVIFTGSGNQLARLYDRRIGLNQQSATGARRYVYTIRDGTVNATDSGAGTFTPGK